MMKSITSNGFLRRLAAFSLAVCLCLTLFPAFIGGGARADYSDTAMDKLVSWGIMSGYPDGQLHPERELTRAEFVAMVNRAYGYTEVGVTPFIDVPDSAWYHDDIGIAYKAKYFTGGSPRMAFPNDSLTREQAVVLLGRNMRLEEIPGEVMEFSDGHSFSKWSAGYARAASDIGIISGYGDGSFRPQNNINRGEMAVMLVRALGTLINTPGVHTLSDNYGSVTISSPNTTLKDSTIAGDLYITGGLDLGSVTLDNVRVLGDIIVAGGGESEGGESVILRNVEADTVKVDSIADQYISLAAEGNTLIGDLSLRTDAYVQDRTRPGEGFLNIELEAANPNHSSFTLSGNLESVVNKSPNSTLTIAMGTVDSLRIDEKATNSLLNLDINSTATELQLDVGTTVIGTGDIANLYVNTSGSDVEMLPETITIRPGIVAEINGELMDAKGALESSSDPRLLAGYPKVKNISAKSATAVFAGNKRGTVYWAISTVTDGSIGEDELVEPTKDNKRIVLNGNTMLEASDIEYSAALDKLTPDSNYYISTVMVDARGRHSPVKVASFTTPDDTVPAFNKGYPFIKLNDYEYVRKDGKLVIDPVTGDPQIIFRAQVAAMANKSCLIYFALYKAGSTEPTTQQFRTGQLGGALFSGVEDITKNSIWYQTFKGLEEQTEYDLYLWLTDADGSRSSKVAKLTFKTTDGTPPHFINDTPLVYGNPPATSIPTRVTIDENATVYWAILKHGENFIKGFTPSASAKTLAEALVELKNGSFTSDALLKILTELKMKIENGSGSLKNGSVRATENREAAINIAGLQAESSYDIYFLAKDAAGNYSDVQVLEDVHTLDTSPPTVTQSFTKMENDDPYADTDILLVFSEDVQCTNDLKDENGNIMTLTSAAKDPKTLATFLESVVSFYNDSGLDPLKPIEYPVDYDSNNVPTGESWVINFRKATVKQDPETGAVTVTLPSLTDASGKRVGALNLKSGSTYHFEFHDLEDLAVKANRIRPDPYKLSPFRTISAQVRLDPINVTSIKWQKDANNSVEVPIDMAFSMTPQSTNVESDVDWDILFWSDYSVTFEVYELDKDKGTGVPVRQVIDGEIASVDGQLAQPSNVEIVNNNAKINENTKLDDYEGYEGRSLFRDFYKLSFFPSITGEGHVISGTNSDLRSSGIMETKKPKYYGIHFTAIKDVDETTGRDKIWDATINFRIGVVTGASNNLLTLSRSINKAKLTEAENDLGITQIHSPRPFFLRAQFANSDAPNFASDWPQFESTDTTLTMRVMLDRPGTLYWVVAPASTRVRQNDGTSTTTYSPTIDTNAYISETVSSKLRFDETITDKTNILYQRYYAPTGTSTEIGSQNRLVPLNGSDITAGVQIPFELSSPSNDRIYSPNFGSDRIKCNPGRITMGTGMETIVVDGLEPDTIYLVYFVTQGTGQVYSKRAQLFQTRTTEISRPYLTVTNGTSSATVTSTNMNATADSGLFLLDTIKNLPLFNKKFINTLDSESRDMFLRDYPDSMIDENGMKYNDYTVLEALRQRDMKGGRGSMFDVYAGEDYINQIAQLIRAEGSSDRINGHRNLKLPIMDGKELSYKLESRQQYCILIVARASAGDDNASGHSLGLGAAYPIHVRDDSLPVITTVGQKMTVNFRAEGAEKTVDGFLMGGVVTLTFDRPLFLYEEATDTRTSLTTSNISSFLSPGQNDSRITIKGISGSGSTSSAVSTVQLTLPNDTFANDMIINVNPLLAGEYSPARESSPLSITLHYDSSIKSVVAQVSDPELWLREGTNTEISTEVIAPAAATITISDGPTTLESNQTAALTATLYPDGSTGRVIWRSSDTSIAKVAGNGVTAEVTALSVSVNKTVTITAQLLNTDGTVKSQDTHTITITPILVKEITLSASTIEFAPGKAALQFITVTVGPAEAANKEINFSAVDSSLVSITKVKQSDTVYQLQITRGASGKEGETMVTITAADGGGAFGYFYVTIKNE